jgi:ankyrin repeat protein
MRIGHCRRSHGTATQASSSYCCAWAPSQESRAEALYWAASRGHINLARRLLDDGVDANDQSGGMALGGAAYDGHLDMLKLLVDADVSGLIRHFLISRS